MKHLFTLLLISLIFSLSAKSQQPFSVMAYNLLFFNETSTNRIPYFKTIIDSMSPDILVVEEMVSDIAFQVFYSGVMDSTYSSGTFIAESGLNSGIFYKESVFSFVSNIPIPTQVRSINKFTLVHNFTGDTLIIFGVHLKSSTGNSNETERAAEVDSLRKVTNKLAAGKFFIVCGDFNLYSSYEPAYIKLMENDSITHGHFIDPLNMPGVWNDDIYAPYHTQSSRTRSFGGGATSGLDDRFDLILFSQGIADSFGITYVNNSLWAVGNDGNHYNDSINSPPNTIVSQTLADALHYASDHLPIIARFHFSFQTGTENTDTEKIIIYPNPSFDALTIETNIENKYRVEIVDLTGALKIMEIYSEPLVRINIQQLAAGSYVVRIISDEGKFEKLIVKP